MNEGHFLWAQPICGLLTLLEEASLVMLQAAVTLYSSSVSGERQPSTFPKQMNTKSSMSKEQVRPGRGAWCWRCPSSDVGSAHAVFHFTLCVLSVDDSAATAGQMCTY